MLHSYKSYTLILESKKRDKKIEKQKDKIHKFLTFKPIIDYVFKKVVDKESTKGLKYTTWFADRISKDFSNRLYNEHDVWNLGLNIPKSIFEKYLKTGEIVFTDEMKEIIKSKKPSAIDPDGYEHGSFKELIKNKIYNTWTWIDNTYDHLFNAILDWLNSPIREEEEVDLSQYDTLQKAYDRAVEWHDNIKATGVINNETGKVLLTFEDGFYWIDLETNSDEDEADAMGHCGTTSYGSTLYSLRKKQSPHVTAAIGDETDVITNDDGSATEIVTSIVHQMKGRNNKKPIEKYFPYIIELLSYPNVSDNVKVVNEFEKIENFSTEEYMPEQDFSVSDLTEDQIVKLKEKNPELINNSGLGVKIKLYKSGLVSAEELVKNIDDLMVVNGEIHFVLQDWTDLDPDIFVPNDNDWQLNALSDDGIADQLFQYQDFDYSYWSKLNHSVYEDILKKLIEKGTTIVYDNNTEGFEMDSKNSKISPNKDDIWIKSPIGGVISIGKILKNSEDKVNTKQGDKIFTSEGLYKVSGKLDMAFAMVQSYADDEEAYKYVLDTLCDVIGPVVEPPSRSVKVDETTKGIYWDDTHIHIKINLDFLSKVYKNDDHENVLHAINEIQFGANANDRDGLDLRIECEEPDGGFGGVIDSWLPELSDEIENRIFVDL